MSMCALHTEDKYIYISASKLTMRCHAKMFFVSYHGMIKIQQLRARVYRKKCFLLLDGVKFGACLSVSVIFFLTILHEIEIFIIK
jgi:hypothetical protein